MSSHRDLARETVRTVRANKGERFEDADRRHTDRVAERQVGQEFSLQPSDISVYRGKKSVKLPAS